MRKYRWWVKPVALEVLRHDDALVPQGVMTWESPGNPVVIKWLTTLPEMHMAVTVDVESTIKLWDCKSREPLATNNLFSRCQLLKAAYTKDGPIVLVSDPQIVVVTQTKPLAISGLFSFTSQLAFLESLQTLRVNHSKP